MERWDRSRSAAVAAIVDSALPGEGLTEDELVAVCFEDVDPTVVVGDADGVAAAVVHEVEGAGRVGFVQLVAVDPSARRRGLGRALVEAVAAWAVEEQGATAVAVGGAAPFYLWAGVDVRATAALCLFESCGFRPLGAVLNMTFPTSFRAPAPAGVALRRVLEDADADAVLSFVAGRWPGWRDEAKRAVDHGTCHVAWRDDGAGPAGFACHSVNRLGWLGPMGTDPAAQRAGVGAALLGAVATDLMAAGLREVEVSWIGPVGFYAKAAGASVGRVFRTLSRPAASSA